MSSEVLEMLDLTKRTLCQKFLREEVGNLLDRHTFIGLCVYGSTVMTPNMNKALFSLGYPRV